jgi:hypothetical protein
MTCVAPLAPSPRRVALTSSSLTMQRQPLDQIVDRDCQAVRRQDGRLGVSRDDLCRRADVRCLSFTSCALRPQHHLTDALASRRNNVKDWHAKYERLAPMVVPRSSSCVRRQRASLFVQRVLEQTDALEPLPPPLADRSPKTTTLSSSASPSSRRQRTSSSRSRARPSSSPAISRTTRAPLRPAGRSSSAHSAKSGSFTSVL